MFKLLNQPYPKDWKIQKGIRAAFVSGFIVFAFLWVFEPFGISGVDVYNTHLFILGYGAVTTFVVLLIIPLPLIFKNFFRDEKWTVGKNIAYFVFIFFCIGIGNWLYTHIMTGLPLVWGSFVFFQFVTVAVAVVVAGSTTLFNYSRFVTLNVEEAKQIEKEVSKIEKRPERVEWTLLSENEKDEPLKVDSASLLFIESADNYSKIIFRKDGQVKSVLLRSSLKRTESQLNHPFVFRCHRSFLVNLTKVDSVSGNSQGYRLHFSGTDETIPVARRTGQELHERLHSLEKPV